MNDERSNGEAWDRMLEQMLTLEVSLESVEMPGKLDQPICSGVQSARAWSRIHDHHRDGVHAAARELVRTGRLVASSPEVLHFLWFRLDAAIQYLAMAVTIRNDRPVSIVPFPPVKMSDYAEWLLIDWADDHLLNMTFPGQGRYIAPTGREPGRTNVDFSSCDKDVRVESTA